MWCSSQTRPDITYAVHRCSRLISNPDNHDNLWARLVRIAEYLRGTIDNGVHYRAGDNPGWPRTSVFTDASFANAYADRRSTTGCIACYNGSPIYWTTKRQSCSSMPHSVVSPLPALSTGEAETNAIQLATREALGIRALQNFTNDVISANSDEWTGPIPLLTRQEVSELAGVCPDATDKGPAVTVLSDSRAAIGTASNPPNRNARHFLLGQSFVRSALAFRLVILKHVTTETQYADALTKAPTPLFLQLLQQLMRGRADMPLAAKIYK